MPSIERVLDRLRVERTEMWEASGRSSNHDSGSLLVAKGRFQGMDKAIEVIQGMIQEDRAKALREEEPEFT